MAPRRFDKKNATTFSVVHRAHDDEHYFDNDASRHVLVPIDHKNKQKNSSSTNKDSEKPGYSREQIEKKLGGDLKSVRENEGMAAQYGIYYDDSKYDYMQHLKPIGKAEDAVFIAKKEKKNNNKQDLFELLKDQLPSEKTNKVTQDNLESIPKELQGFNPNLDPRVREILEALEDEAYIENENEDTDANTEADAGDDIFNDLLQSGEVDDDYIDGDEEYYGDDQDFDEWDLDNYEQEYDAKYDSDNFEEQVVPYNEGEAPEELAEPTHDKNVVNTAWERDFQKFKSQSKQNDWDSDDDFDEDEEVEEPDKDVLGELPNFSKKKSNTKERKKKGAMTDTSSFSMSSSAVFRTEGLTLLDDRYEKLARDFEKDDNDEEYQEFDMNNERQDLEGMLDDFLDNYDLDRGGRRLMKKDDEITRLQEASDKVSKGKASARRMKMKQEAQQKLQQKDKDVLKMGNSFGKLSL